MRKFLLSLFLIIAFALPAHAQKVWVDDAGTWRQAQHVWIDDSGTWRSAAKVWVNQTGTWRLVFTSSFTCTIGINTQQNFVINGTSCSGWDGSAPLIATITVNSGQVIGSNSTSTPAFTVPSLPAGSTVTIINNGYIVGHGGDGASFTTVGASVGGDGGTALSLSFNTTIQNGSGVIGGGGGGGGGQHKDNATEDDPGQPGGAGGGGAGNSVGINGANEIGQIFGTAATLTAGGTGSGTGGHGGGGALGGAGGDGGDTAGGSGGACKTGSGTLTFSGMGTTAGSGC